MFSCSSIEPCCIRSWAARAWLGNLSYCQCSCQVCLKWNVQRGVTVIPRSQNPKNIKANIEGMFEWVLPREAKVHSPQCNCGELHAEDASSNAQLNGKPAGFMTQVEQCPPVHMTYSSHAEVCQSHHTRRPMKQICMLDDNMYIMHSHLETLCNPSHQEASEPTVHERAIQ